MVTTGVDLTESLAEWARPWQERLLDHPLLEAIQAGTIPRANLGQLNTQMYLRVQGTHSRILNGMMQRPDRPLMERRMHTMEEEFGHDTLLLDAAADYGQTLAEIEGGIPTVETETQNLYQRSATRALTPADGPFFAFLVEGLFDKICRRVCDGLRERYAATPAMLAFYEVHIEADVRHGEAGRLETAALRLDPAIERQAKFNIRRHMEVRELYYDGILRACLNPPPPLPTGLRPTAAFFALLDETLRPWQARILDHPHLRALEAGTLSPGEVAALVIQLHHLAQRLPFVLLQGLMRHPDHAAAGRWARTSLLDRDIFRRLTDWGRSVGLDESTMDGAESMPETQGFALWLERLAAGDVPQAQEAFACATLRVLPDLCRRLAKGLRTHYGSPEDALTFFKFYADAGAALGGLVEGTLRTYLPEREDFQRQVLHNAQRGLEYWTFFLDGCERDRTIPLRRSARPLPVLGA
jgi:pyrroloquinoline quinone (PQQ) biosynthesis protein C